LIIWRWRKGERYEGLELSREKVWKIVDRRRRIKGRGVCTISSFSCSVVFGDELGDSDPYEITRGRHREAWEELF